MNAGPICTCGDVECMHKLQKMIIDAVISVGLQPSMIVAEALVGIGVNYLRDSGVVEVKAIEMIVALINDRYKDPKGGKEVLH